MNRMLRTAMVLALSTALAGCYTVTYDLEGMDGLSPNGNQVKDFRIEMSNGHFIAGLVTPASPDIPGRIKQEIQNNGGRGVRNLRITHQVTFIDGLISGVTLGIYTPTTVIIEGDVIK